MTPFPRFLSLVLCFVSMQTLAQTRSVQDQVKALLAYMEQTAQHLHRQAGSLAHTIHQHELRNISHKSIPTYLPSRFSVQAVKSPVDEAAQLVARLANDSNEPTKEFLNDVQARVNALVSTSASQAITLKEEFGSGSAAQGARDEVDAQVASWEADLQEQVAGIIDSARSRAENISQEMEVDGGNQTGSNVSGKAQTAIVTIADWYGDLQSSVSSFTGEFQDRAGSLRSELEAIGEKTASGSSWGTSSWLEDVTLAASNVSDSIGSNAIEGFLPNVTAAINETYPLASNVSESIKSAAKELNGRIRKVIENDTDPTPRADEIFRTSKSIKVGKGFSIVTLLLSCTFLFV